MAGFPSKAKGNSLAENAKRPRPGVPFVKPEVIKLIENHAGNLSKVADALGTSRSAIRNFVSNNEDVKECLSECRERWIDDIEESVLSRANESNDTALQCFVLKTQGRHRGWEQEDNKNAAKDIATAAFQFIVSKSNESK